MLRQFNHVVLLTLISVCLFGCVSDQMRMDAERIYTSSIKPHRMIIFPPMFEGKGFDKGKIENGMRSAARDISFKSQNLFSLDWRKWGLPYLDEVIIGKNAAIFYEQVKERQDYFLKDYGRRKRYNLIVFSFITHENDLKSPESSVDIRCFFVDKKLLYPLIEKIPVSHASLEDSLYWKERIMRFVYIFYADIKSLTKNSESFTCDMY